MHSVCRAFRPRLEASRVPWLLLLSTAGLAKAQTTTLGVGDFHTCLIYVNLYCCAPWRWPVCRHLPHPTTPEKCSSMRVWSAVGKNDKGQLGIDSTNEIGKSSGQYGMQEIVSGAIGPVYLGGSATRVNTATGVCAGQAHTCAILNTGGVRACSPKCPPTTHARVCWHCVLLCCS